MTYQSTLQTARVDLETATIDEECTLACSMTSQHVRTEAPICFGARFLLVTSSTQTCGEEPKFRLILVGKSGGGKSATGNTILGQKEFESLMTAKTTTLRCQKGEGTWQDMKICVVDTPNMFDAKGYDEIVQREIIACVKLSRPGPHALILVTQVGRFTGEDAAAVKCVQDIFGAEYARHTIILFTCVEDLGGNPLQEYVQKSDNRNLRELVRRCGNRVCGFNNKAKGEERERQVTELMEMVQRIVSANGGRYYTNRLYQMRNIRDEHVKEFLAREKTGRERLAQRSWSRVEIVTVVGSCCLLVGIVIMIILLIHFS